MRVFLASSYHSGSHRAWAEGYARHSAHDVHLVTMPGSFWQWRLTGGFVTLARGVEELIDDVGRPDLVLATSLIDVAGLRGLLSRRHGSIPVALYMHENQVTYPAISRTRTERNYGLINWTSLIAADVVAFNSGFHRSALFDALPGFLGEFPDERHHDLLEGIAAKTSVLPVGVEMSEIGTGPKLDPPVIVWNHRWDPDKDPESFLRLMHRLDGEGIDFQVALAGERFVNQRPEFDEAVDALGSRILTDDHLDRGRYLETLASASVVVSTAQQEFFGVSIVEAMAAGAFPILPNRLVYPERVPEEVADRALYRSEEHATSLLRMALQDVDRTRTDGATLRSFVEEYDWSAVAPAYDSWLESVPAS